ncbi:MAG TPA: hypothetical protein VGE28_19360 [Pseudomonas sp.]
MSLEYIRNYYGVPAKKGGRVNAYGKPGTITGARNAHLLIKLDSEQHSNSYHPTDGIEYLESKPSTTAIIAYCWAGGLIQFGPSVPDGAIGIARGEEAKVRDVIEATASHAKDNERLLVPGVPEAANEREGLAALARYIQWLGERNSPGFRAMGA